MKRNFIVFIAMCSNIVLGCTADKNTSDSMLKIAPPISDPNLIAPSTPILPEIPIAVSSNEAEKIIGDVQINLNKEPQYSLSDDDLSILTEAGLNEVDLKGWVK